MTVVDISLWNPPAEALPLWNGTPPGFLAEAGQPAPTLMPYRIRSAAPTGAVLILPGGGYGKKAAHEAAPVAEWLNGLGIAAFVLDYRVAPYHHPVPLLDARRAVQLIRARAQEWSVDPHKIAALGFSAGGHLASTLGTHFEAVTEPAVMNDDVIDDAVTRCDFRPDALILCYPVISFGPYAHIGSMENLLGPDPTQAQRQAFSNEMQVSTRTPSTFLWHTASDPSVPVENSLMFARALRDQGIPFELHIFAEGEHGIGMAHGHPSAEPWSALCGQWLKNMGFTGK